MLGMRIATRRKEWVPTTLRANVSDGVCTTNAHLSFCMLRVLGVRVVVTIIDGEY